MTVQASGRTVHVRAYPISIDVAALEEQASTDASDEHLADLDERLVRRPARPARRPHRPEQEHRARLHRLRPAARGAPELHGRVQFLALLQPSRQDVPEYASYLADIGAAAASVNAKHGTGDWQPVDLRLASDMALATAAYRRCDVLVVNAVGRRMNLGRQGGGRGQRARHGARAVGGDGAHDELGRFAVTLHPFDVAQQADALHEALTMPRSCGGSARARRAVVPPQRRPALAVGAAAGPRRRSGPTGHSGRSRRAGVDRHREGIPGARSVTPTRRSPT
jgi:trehalose 6-phosphate synthase